MFFPDNSADGGQWATVLGTEHKTNDTESIGAKIAHQTLSTPGPNQFREVTDTLGEPCSVTTNLITAGSEAP